MVALDGQGTDQETLLNLSQAPMAAEVHVMSVHTTCLQLQALLQQYVAKYSSGQPMSTFSHLAVQQILGLQAIGLPGNGVCELGELPTAMNAGANQQPITHGDCWLHGMRWPADARQA